MLILFVSCQALALEVRVQQMPLAATVSINDLKENRTLLKTDGDSPKKEQDTIDQEKITPLKIGDKIPDELWDLPLQVVNHPEGKVGTTEQTVFYGPLPLGRKNYLFAGSHQAAQRAAMIFSFLAICKKHEVDPYKWLKYTLYFENSGLIFIHTTPGSL